MRRAIAATVVLAVALLLTGCGRSEKTLAVPGGKMKVTEKSRHGKEATVEFETRQGRTVVTTEKRTITEAELGAPVYPGATVEVSGKYEGKEGSGESTFEQHVLTTKDSFEKVVEFYKSHLKDIKGSYNQSQSDQKMAMFQMGDKGEKVIHVVWDGKEQLTRIQVMAGSHQPAGN